MDISKFCPAIQTLRPIVRVGLRRRRRRRKKEQQFSRDAIAVSLKARRCTRAAPEFRFTEIARYTVTRPGVFSLAFIMHDTASSRGYLTISGFRL